MASIPDNLRGSDHKPFELYNGYTATIVDEDNDGDADKVVVVIEYLAEVTKVNAATASTDRSVNMTVTDTTGKVTVTNVETEDFEKGRPDPGGSLLRQQGTALRPRWR